MSSPSSLESRLSLQEIVFFYQVEAALSANTEVSLAVDEPSENESLRSSPQSVGSPFQSVDVLKNGILPISALNGRVTGNPTSSQQPPKSVKSCLLSVQTGVVSGAKYVWGKGVRVCHWAKEHPRKATLSALSVTAFIVTIMGAAT